MLEEIKEDILRYESLKRQAKELDVQIKEAGKIIIEHMPDDAKVQGEFGILSVQTRNSYTFGPAVKAIEKDLKAKKEEEIATGTAKVSTSKILYYRENGESDNT